MARSWLIVIGKLKRFLKEVGELFPNSTKLSGYAENGPYHCGDCIFLRKKEGKAFRDAEGRGRCNQPVVISDPEVKKDDKMIPIVNIEHGCCAFVEYEPGYIEESDDKD